MSFKKQHITLLSLVLCLLVVLTGCGNKSANEQTPQTPANDQNMTTPAPQNDSNGTNNGTNSDANANNDNSPVENLKESNDMSERAEKIAKAIVDGVEDVEDANVIISEHLAYAAIKIKADDPKGEAEAIKKAVIEKAKAADSDLTDIYVSESADVFARIKEIGDDIGEGKPISGFVEELENLFVRITPTNPSTNQ